MKILDIKDEFYLLNKLIAEESEAINPETGEFFDNTETINELAAELKEKKSDLLDFLSDKRLEAKGAKDIIAEKIKQLQEKKKTFDNQDKRLLETMDFVLEGEKFKSSEHTYYYAKSESVEILDKEDIPSQFISFEPKIAVSDLKKALKAGEEIKGAVLNEKIGLRVR